MRHVALNLTILSCLVAAVAAGDAPEWSLLILFLVIAAWVVPGLWRLREVRVQL